MMWETLNNLIVSAMDWLLGWLLYLPRDGRLVAVAVLTSLILVVARKLMTDQDWLRRAHADRRTLKRLTRQARKAGDKEARLRYRQSMTLLHLRSMKHEGKTLLAAVIPVALLATWCFARIDYLPAEPGQTIEVRAYFPAFAIGRVTHLVPQEGITCADGWVRQIEKDQVPAPAGAWDRFNAALTPARPHGAEGVATWRIQAEPSPRPYVLKVRDGGKTYEKELIVDGRHYAPVVAFFDDEPVRSIETVLPRTRLFGVVGAIDVLYLPPWLVAYLLIAIPFVSILKRVLRVY